MIEAHAPALGLGRIPPGRDPVCVLQEGAQLFRGVVQGLDALGDGLFEKGPCLCGSEPFEHDHHGIHQLVALPHVVVEHACKRGRGDVVLDIEPIIEQDVSAMAPNPAELVLALGNRPQIHPRPVVVVVWMGFAGERSIDCGELGHASASCRWCRHR
ncbi:Uncharacterised protein [Mycobacteroides abscessus subsp. massiliense]|nr:Uncharacterised protein [Mycobacteroides abscessus subsp. massiliense]